MDGNCALTLQSDLCVISNGTTALKVPAGTASQKPLTPLAGMIRFNTSNSFLEGFDGNNWYNIPFVSRDITPLNVITITNDYTITESDYYIFVNAMAKNIEVTLVKSNPGMTLVIKKNRFNQ